MTRNKPGGWKRPRQEWVKEEGAALPLNARYTGSKVTIQPVRAGTLAAKIRLAAYQAAGDKLPLGGLNIIEFNVRENVCYDCHD